MHQLWQNQRTTTMYRHIFFDLDRTLWDFDTNTKDTIREIYYSYNLPERISDDFDAWYANYQRHNIHLWDLYALGEIKKETLRDTRFYLALKDYGIDDKALGLEYGKKFVEQSPLKTTLFPHAHEVLSYLHSKYKLHIITNGFNEIQFTKLRNTQLEQYFDKVFTSEDIGYHKPHAGIFQHAVSSLNAKKETCIMVGDDFKADILGAKKFGIDQVYFRHNDKVFDEKPTYEIRSLNELESFL